MEITPTHTAQISTSETFEIEYTLGTEDFVFEGTEPNKTYLVEIGSGKLHPLLEKELLKYKAGESFQIRLDASVGFGFPDPALIIQVAKSKVPTTLAGLKIGSSFEAPGPDKKKRKFRVTFENEKTITIDGNHPLAGELIVFEGKVISRS
jgi:FKBP-type peptidyl-prolyl cis-trans isomerase 2